MLRQLAAFSLGILAACGGSDEASPPPVDAVSPPAAAPQIAEVAAMRTAPDVDLLQIHVLACGEIDVADLADYGYPGETDLLTPTCWLVRHPKGNLIWQLGLPSILAGQPGMESPPLSLYLEQSLTEQLAILGLSPDDIGYVAISHSDFHTIGQADQFPGATWLVSDGQLARMFPAVEDGEAEIENGQNAAFIAMQQRVVDGSYDVFGDRSVMLIPAPGPTPGHMALKAQLAETGPIVLAGGLYHRAEALADKTVPSFHTNPEQTRSSMMAVQSLVASEGARMIIETEPDHIDQLPKLPLALR